MIIIYLIALLIELFILCACKLVSECERLEEIKRK